MTKPYYTFKQNSQKVGSFYDWPTGGHTVTGEQVGWTEVEIGDVPVTQSHRRSRDGVYRTGGTFFQYKVRKVTGGSSQAVFRPGYGKAYSGQFYLSDANDLVHHLDLQSPYDQDSVLQNLFGFGVSALDRLRADKPDFSTLNALYELKDTFHELKSAVQYWRRKTYKEMQRRRIAGRTAEWYLAIHMGWLPTLRDAQNFAHSLRQGDKRARQVLRDSGKPIRRRATLSRSGDSDDGSFNTPTYSPWSGGGYGIGANRPILVSNCYGYGTGGSGHSTSGEEVWCSGQARYLISDEFLKDKDAIYKMRMRLLGNQITPSVVWNAVPWTWLGDYFSNIGAFINNASEGVADRHWFDYAYIMNHKWFGKRDSTWQRNAIDVAGHAATVTTFRATTESYKARIAANPFGFTTGTPSVKQEAILGALGFSRLPNT